MLRTLAAAALLLLPVVAAQAPLDPVFTVEPFAAPLAPLQAPSATPFRLELLCEPALPGDAGEVHVWVGEAPAWLDASVLPDVFEADDCAGSRTAFEGALVAQARETAPAFAPAPVVLAFAYETARGNLTGTATTEASAGYFGILAIHVGDAIVTARPGEVVTFSITVENRGNARGLVTVTFREVADGLEAMPVEPFELQSAQEGGGLTSLELPLHVRAAEGTGYLNRVGNVEALLTLTRAENGAQGDDGSVSVLVLTRGLDTPATGALTALAAVAWAAWRRRSR